MLQDARSGETRPFPGEEASETSFAWSADSRHVGITAWKGPVKVVDLADGKVVSTIGDSAWGPSIWSPDGSVIATAGEDRRAVLWNAATGKKLHELSFHVGGVSCLAFSGDGRLVVTGSSDFSTRVWDVATGTAVFTFRGHTRAVIGTFLTRDGRHLYTASADSTARIVELASGREVVALSAG